MDRFHCVPMGEIHTHSIMLPHASSKYFSFWLNGFPHAHRVVLNARTHDKVFIDSKLLTWSSLCQVILSLQRISETLLAWMWLFLVFTLMKYVVSRCSYEYSALEFISALPLMCVSQIHCAILFFFLTRILLYTLVYFSKEFNYPQWNF